MTFSGEQNRKLEQLLPDAVVQTTPFGGHSYVSGDYAIQRANEVFGFGGWSYIVKRVEEIGRGTVARGDKENVAVAFRAEVRVEVYTQSEFEQLLDMASSLTETAAKSQGAALEKVANELHAVIAQLATASMARPPPVVREDVGTGKGEGAAINLFDFYDTGYKAAVTDAVKRALRTFGATFGLELYKKQGKQLGASFKAQDLMADLAKVERAPGTLSAWRKANEPEIETLAPADKEEVNNAFRDARNETIEQLATKDALGAPDAETLEKLFVKAQQAGLEKPRLDRIAAASKRRKDQLARTAAGG